MKKILIVVLTYNFHFGIFPRIWENTLKVKIPKGYKADFIAVIDSPEVKHPKYKEFKKYVDKNNIDLRIAKIDMRKGKRFLEMDYVHPQSRFTQTQVFRVSETRNFYRQIAIDGNYDYLLNVDGDVLIPPNALELLLSIGKPLTGGWTYNKKQGGLLFSPNKIEYGTPYVVRMLGAYCLLEEKDVFTKVAYRLYKNKLNTTDDFRRNSDFRYFGYQIWLHPYAYCQHLKVDGEIYEPGKDFEKDGQWY